MQNKLDVKMNDKTEKWVHTNRVIPGILEKRGRKNKKVRKKPVRMEAGSLSSA